MKNFLLYGLFPIWGVLIGLSLIIEYHGQGGWWHWGDFIGSAFLTYGLLYLDREKGFS